ncbi:DUF488 family protein [Deinococcus radiopugnans]|uniref:DUF488 domain-containing protein n=1 Tax=Deinococcus radiopugnans ATCC 19172 TaxID=585398 RepID=A0A5C4Y8J3_9DEIO|nr:DUF488 domain-containing protein [Deinococcus radiopugnans]MBB6016386.1 uncharacterized protein (DUF488 family) [Deinococcus radiopugnans ATCC 19172]TNM71349.1 DUF488 domain-containing protein [Deinococcus radiopugnans ATCC 19172]
MNRPFYTVGHSTRTLEEFVELLRAGEVERIVDVRLIRRSRTNPQYDEATLGTDLGAFGIAYEPIPKLGGRRPKSTTVPPDINGMWENQSFHNYADYALSDEFRAGLEQLIMLGRERNTAVMCSEAVWWRCHRRMISDHLLARDEAVFHLMGRDQVEPAQLNKGAVVETARTVIYPAPSGEP